MLARPDDRQAAIIQQPHVLDHFNATFAAPFVLHLQRTQSVY
jgi:hypothetical protein